MSDFVVSRVVMDTLEKVKKNSVLAEKWKICAPAGKSQPVVHSLLTLPAELTGSYVTHTERAEWTMSWKAYSVVEEQRFYFVRCYFFDFSPDS
jgi:hypothetical protein